MSTLGWQRPSISHPGKESSRERPALRRADTVAVATSAAAVVGRSPRVGYVPGRANFVRDGRRGRVARPRAASAVEPRLRARRPRQRRLVFLVVGGGHAARHPRRADAARRPVPAHRSRPECPPHKPDPAASRRSPTSSSRSASSSISCWRPGAAAEPAWCRRGSGPACCSASGARCWRHSRRSRVSPQDNGFRRWYAFARVLGVVSIALATLAVAFNVYWRLRYLFVTNGAFGSQDFAVIVTTLLYGAEAMIALVIASRWLTERTAAARLATSALGASGAVAATLVWILPIGRDVDAFHGIARTPRRPPSATRDTCSGRPPPRSSRRRRSTPIFLIKPPTLGAYRSAAEKCLTLIAFWAFASAALRVIDYLIAWSLDLPHALYDTVAMTVFNVITGLIARWLHRQLVRGEASLPVIAAFSGLLFVFTVANLAIGVALAPRYAEPSPTADLRQQPGPADHQHVRRDHLRAELRRVGRHAVHRAAGGLPDTPPARPELPKPAALASRWPRLHRGLRATDTRAAFATRCSAENCSAEGGFDDGARGAADGGDRRAHRRPSHPASRTVIRADDRAAHAAGGRRRARHRRGLTPSADCPLRFAKAP